MVTGTIWNEIRSHFWKSAEMRAWSDYSPVLSSQASLLTSLSFNFPSYKSKIAQHCAPNTVWRAWQLPSTYQQPLPLALSLLFLNSQPCINCFTFTREIRNKKTNTDVGFFNLRTCCLIFQSSKNQNLQLRKDRALDLVHSMKELDSKGTWGVQLFFQDDTENRNRTKEDQEWSFLVFSTVWIDLSP